MSNIAGQKASTGIVQVAVAGNQTGRYPNASFEVHASGALLIRNLAGTLVHAYAPNHWVMAQYANA